MCFPVSIFAVTRPLFIDTLKRGRCIRRGGSASTGRSESLGSLVFDSRIPCGIAPQRAWFSEEITESMTLTIHPTAIVSPTVELSEDIAIGPYCVLDGAIRIGAGTRLISHVSVSGNTTIGKRCTIYPFASLGHPPQDRRYRGEPVSLIIGDDNIIREYVTMHAGTADGSQVTRVGNSCFFMVGAHVAHDCKVGNHVVLANHATLGGHVEVGDHVFIGGLSAIHQFARIGKHAMVSGAAGIQRSVIPYGMAIGFGASLDGLNFVGLKRRGFSRSAIQTLRRVFSRLFRDSDGTMAERIEQITEENADSPEVKELIAFIAENEESGRGLCMPKSRTLASTGKSESATKDVAQDEPRMAARIRTGIITEGGQ